MDYVFLPRPMSHIFDCVSFFALATMRRRVKFLTHTRRDLMEWILDTSFYPSLSFCMLSFPFAPFSSLTCYRVCYIH